MTPAQQASADKTKDARGGTRITEDSLWAAPRERGRYATSLRD